MRVDDLPADAMAAAPRPPVPAPVAAAATAAALRRSRQRGWSTALAALVVYVAAVIVLHRAVAGVMVSTWAGSETFKHAFMVPPISAWLVWRQRHALARLAPRPSPVWLLPIALGAAVLWLGTLASVNVVAQFALMTMLVAGAPLLLGTTVARAILFPLAFLFFAVPAGEFLTPWLMRYTADFTVAAVRASGVPVFREGQQFVIPTGRWSVVEACSGIRYLIASVTVGALFAYLNYRGAWRRAAFVVASVAVPIVANWLRAYMIVMLGHLSNNRIATGVDHLVYGWVFFGVVIALLFVVGARWAQPNDPPGPDGPDGPEALGRAATPRSPATFATVASVVAALAIVALPQLGARAADSNSDAAPTLALGNGAGGWRLGGEAPLWQPHYSGHVAAAAGVYDVAGGLPVAVQIRYYRDQDGQAKLVSSINQIIPAEDPSWNALALPPRPTGLGGRWQRHELLGPELPGRPRRHMAVWLALWADGRFVDSPIEARLAHLRARVSGRPDDAAAVFLHAEAADLATAEAALAEFERANLATLSRLLDEARRR